MGDPENPLARGDLLDVSPPGSPRRPLRQLLLRLPCPDRSRTDPHRPSRRLQFRARDRTGLLYRGRTPAHRPGADVAVLLPQGLRQPQ